MKLAKIQGLLEKFNEIVESLEKIEKKLEQYL
jgi:tetrahydromethanopterin S-methyltransferase subunit G